MANNLIYFDTTNNSIQQFSANDVAKICDYILEYMAANGTFTGSITIGTSNPIGTFTDTTLGGYPYPTANSDNVTVYSTTYTLSQINTATLTAQSDPPKYLGLDTTSVANTVILQEDKTTLNDLADEIIDRMVPSVGYGVNGYSLGWMAPADGGVWVDLGSLVDALDPSNPNVTFKLWKKLNSGSYTTDFKRPLKLSSGELLQFSNTEIQQIVKTVEQRIVATGKGMYALSETAPATGTWQSVGYAADVRRTTTEVDFDGSNYQSDFIGSENYTGTLPDGANYTAVTTYTGDDVNLFTSTFIIPDGAVFYNPVFSPDATTWGGAQYLGDDALSYVSGFESYNTDFTASVDYLGPSPTFFGPVSYLGTTFVSVFTAPSFTGTFTVPAGPLYAGTPYVGPTGTFTANFQRPAASYVGPAFSAGSFVGYFTASFTNPFVPFQSPASVPYTTIVTYISPNYIGPSDVFTSTYLGPQWFVGPYYYGPGIIYYPYVGPGYYIGDYLGPQDFSGNIDYTGPLPDGTNYDGVATYITDYTGTYTGTRVDTPTTTINTVYLWRRIA